jgi:hypothetical protein
MSSAPESTSVRQSYRPPLLPPPPAEKDLETGSPSQPTAAAAALPDGGAAVAAKSSSTGAAGKAASSILNINASNGAIGGQQLRIVSGGGSESEEEEEEEEQERLLGLQDGSTSTSHVEMQPLAAAGSLSLAAPSAPNGGFRVASSIVLDSPISGIQVMPKQEAVAAGDSVGFAFKACCVLFVIAQNTTATYVAADMRTGKG